MNFRASRFKALVALAVILSAGSLAACSSTDENPGTGAVNTGTYPNLNIKPGIAADQFTPEERAAKSAELKGSQARSKQSGGGAPENEQAALNQLGRTHAKKTLDEIENKDCGTRPDCE